METSKVDGKRIVRSLELKAFRGVVNALRAQGSLTENKQDVLKKLASTLKIGEERCRCELRRAVNDEFLTSLAQCSNGKNTDNNWRLLSARKIPLTPMIAPQTVFTALADNVVDLIALENMRLSQLSTSLQAIADAREFRTNSNASQYHSNKLLGSLLSGKSFQNDIIEPYLDEIALREKYARHGWSWPPVPIEESQVFVEKTTQETSNESDIKISEEPLKIVPNNVIESNHTDGSSHIRKKSSSKKKLLATNDGNGIIREMDDEQNIKHILVKKRGRKPKRLDPSKSAHNTIALVDSKRNVRSRSIRDHNRRRTRRPDRRRLKRSKNRDQIESVVDEESVSEIKGIGARIITTSAKGPAPVTVNSSRRKDKSRQIIDIDFDEIEIENVKENDKRERYQSKLETAISPNVQEKDESRRLSADDFKFSVDLSQLIEDETKPHTFNLIPASRRLKLLQKRVSLDADNEIPAKRTFYDTNSVDSPLLCDLSNGSVEDVLSKENPHKLELFNNAAINTKRTTGLTGYVPDGYRDSKSFAYQSSTTKKLSLLGSITLRTLNSTPFRHENSTRLLNSCDNINHLSNSEERMNAKAVQDEDGRLLGFSRKSETVAVREESIVDSSDIEFSEEYSSPSSSSSSTMSALSPAPSISEKLPKSYSKSEVTFDDNVDIFVEERDESNESQRSSVEIENMKLESLESDSKDELISKVFSDGIQEITLNMKPEDLTSENEEIIVIESDNSEVEAVESEKLLINEKEIGGLMKINVSPANVELKTTKLKSATLTLRCGTNVQVIDSSMVDTVRQPCRRVSSELNVSDKTSLADDEKLKKSLDSDYSSSKKDYSNKSSMLQNTNQSKFNKILDSSVNDIIENGETHSPEIVKKNVTNTAKKTNAIKESSPVGDIKRSTMTNAFHDENTFINGVISTPKSLKPGISVTTRNTEDITRGESDSGDMKNSGSTCDNSDCSSTDKLTISRTVPQKMIELYNAIENTDFLDLLQKRMKL